MKNVGNILWGVILILIGIIFGLNSLNITNINIFFDGWWTLIIIIPSFIGIIKDHDKTSNLVGLIIGIVLLLSVRGIISFELVLKLTIPAILVIIGLTMILKDLFSSKIKNEIRKLNKANDNGYCATFSAQNVSFDDEKFNGCELDAVFGSVKLDLRKAIINDDVVINASSIFGGISILVGDNIRVKVVSTSIFGGVENKHKEDKEKNGKTIYVKSTCLFGGIDIK